MVARPLQTRRQAALACAYAAVAALACAGLLSAAALVPVPPALLPPLAATCIGIPMMAAFDLRASIAALRGGAELCDEPRPLDSKAIRQLRRHLAQLPETNHPLGL